jgi:hypothetical protein
VGPLRETVITWRPKYSQFYSRLLNIHGSGNYPESTSGLIRYNVVTSGYGTAPRNVLRGPGRTNLDVSLAKTTPLYRERITLELRVDAFNVLNHTEFNNLDNNAQDIGSTFGQVTGAYDPRILQLGAHLRF